MNRIARAAQMSCLAAILMPYAASALVSKVICVPWQGDPTKHHTAISGSPTVRLKAVIKTTSTAAIYYKWVYGDGTESGVSSASGNTQYKVESTRAYTGASGTPFTAQLVASDNSALTTPIIDSYLVKLEDNTLDARINIAIDEGLWYLFKQGVMYTGSGGPFYTMDSTPRVIWSYSSYFAAPTASSIQAFQINGHKETGNFDEDPYAEFVKGGLAWLLRGYYSSATYPMLRSFSLGLQHGVDNPDSRVNGKGIEVRDYGYDPAYEGGNVMDAIIASGTPNASCGRDFDGDAVPETYQQVVQDMLDAYAWGQDDRSSGGIIGGWRYTWNSDSDNSAAQWAAIGMIPAQEAPWNCLVPTWVKTYNNNWLNYSHSQHGTPTGTWGKFGYTVAGQFIQPDYQGASTTPSGMIQLIFAGATTSDPRWVRCERWFSDQWDIGQNWISGSADYSMYGVYAFAKAMRLARPNPVVTFTAGTLAGFDWYRGSSGHLGVAKKVSDKLIGNAGTYPNAYWEGPVLATAWAVIVLRPTLFAEAPIACFTAHPTPNFADQPITFDPSCSSHSEAGKGLANLTKFEWDWNNDGTYDESTAAPNPVIHSFGCTTVPCTYPVNLRVTDDSTPPRTATFVKNISITDPPHPPVSKPKGQYLVSLCAGDALTLDGSDSYDPDEGLRQSGCDTCPFDTITAWNWDLNGAPFTYSDVSGESVALGAGFTSFFPAPGSYNIGLRVTDNTVASYPASGQANLTDEGFGVVSVFGAGPCEVSVKPGCNSVEVRWVSTGAEEYRVIRSFTGPNADFVDVGGTTETNVTVAAALGTPQWFRVLARTGTTWTMSGSILAQLLFTDCQCVYNLVARPKSMEVQLTWTAIAGAKYNVYRSTAPGVTCVPANRIVSDLVTDYALYLDRGLVNGTRYYYKVTVVKDGKEVCVSSEVSAVPTLPRR